MQKIFIYYDYCSLLLCLLDSVQITVFNSSAQFNCCVNGDLKIALYIACQLETQNK